MRESTAEPITWRSFMYTPKSFLRFEILTVQIALAAPFLEWCFRPQTLSHFLEQWMFALVYANCIGLLLWNITPQIWERTMRRPKVTRWILRGSIILLGTAIGCVIGDLILLAILGGGWPVYWRELEGSFKISVIISGVVCMFIGMNEHLHAQLRTREIELKSKELERERALKLATEARLASLESRIHPHFLFNAINSVSSLIHEDPQRAERLLVQMAALLRFSLDSAQAGLVPLERELKIVRDYLDIESARFGLRLRYEIDVPGELFGFLVPPLSLQTLVENSVKYAVNSRRQGAFIRVTAVAESGSATLEVSDDGPGFSRLDLPVGHGLNNLQERLHALFDERAQLTVSSSAAGSSVRVTIPGPAMQAGSVQAENVPIEATR